MKKLKKIILSLVAMTFLMSTTVFAATAEESLASVKAKLTEAGLSATYVDQVSTYLTQNTITEEQANSLIANINDVKAIVGTKTEASQFTPEEKDQVIAKVQTAATSVGLVITKSGDTVKVLNASTGAVVGTATTTEATTIAKNLDTTKITEAVTLAKEYSKVATGSTTTQATAMKKTATNNGNVLVLGLGVLALAGSVFVVSKKVTA